MKLSFVEDIREVLVRTVSAGPACPVVLADLSSRAYVFDELHIVVEALFLPV